MKILSVILISFCLQLHAEDCSKQTKLCDDLVQALKVDVSALRTQNTDLTASNKDLADQLHSIAHPIIPDWAFFGIGFLVGAVGLRLVTK